MSNLAVPSRHLYGALLVATAATCWSSAGILIRHMQASGWQILFWRSAFMALSLIGWLGWKYGRQGWARVTAMGWAGAASGVLLAFTFAFFILSITRTAVANTLLIMSSSPFLSAMFAGLLLKEKVSPRTWATIAVGFSGIAVMVGQSLHGGGLSGNLLALGVAVTFSLNTVLMRSRKEIDMIPAVCLAGIFSAASAALPAWPVTVSLHDLGLLAILGGFQLSLGLVLFTIGTRHLPVAEVGLLSVLETILGPIWVWIGIGEKPPAATLAGGAIVLAALVTHTLLGARRSKAPVGLA